MFLKGLCASVVVLIVLGFLAGIVAAALLATTPAAAKADAPLVTHSIHLTDAQGQVRAIIGVGKDGEPEISVVGPDGKVAATEKLMPSITPRVYAMQSNP